jgi:hypothetical protein
MTRKQIFILIISFLLVVSIFIFLLVSFFGRYSNSSNNSNISSSSTGIVEQLTGFPQDQILPNIPKQINDLKNDLANSSNTSAISKNLDQKSNQNPDANNETLDKSFNNKNRNISSSSDTNLVEDLSNLPKSSNSKTDIKTEIAILEKSKITEFQSGAKLVRITKVADRPKSFLSLDQTTPKNPDIPQLYLIKGDKIILPSPNLLGIYEFKHDNQTKYFWFNDNNLGGVNAYVSDESFSVKISIQPYFKSGGFLNDVVVQKGDLRKMKVKNYPGNGIPDNFETDFKQEEIDFDLISYLDDLAKPNY